MMSGPGEAWYRGKRGLVTTHGSREGRLGAGGQDTPTAGPADTGKVGTTLHDVT